MFLNGDKIEKKVYNHMMRSRIKGLLLIIIVL